MEPIFSCTYLFNISYLSVSLSRSYIRSHVILDCKLSNRYIFLLHKIKGKLSSASEISERWDEMASGQLMMMVERTQKINRFINKLNLPKSIFSFFIFPTVSLILIKYRNCSALRSDLFYLIFFKKIYIFINLLDSFDCNTAN